MNTALVIAFALAVVGALGAGCTGPRSYDVDHSGIRTTPLSVGETVSCTVLALGLVMFVAVLLIKAV